MSSLVLGQIDKERFILQIELALSDNWITQQQAKDLKHIFGDRGRVYGALDDVKWDDIVSVLLDHNLRNIKNHNEDTSYLKDEVLPRLKSVIRSSMMTARYLKIVWRMIYDMCAHARQASNYFDMNNYQNSYDSFYDECFVNSDDEEASTHSGMNNQNSDDSVGEYQGEA